jgi:phasin family protein
MSTLTEQFSAARKSQVEAQINFFQNYTAKAFESAQKIVALNLSVSRASMEKSSAAVVELLAAKDPRDLFALTTRTQESIDSLLAYNRALIAIAASTGAALAAKPVEAVAESKAPALALVKPEPEPQAEVAAPELVAPVAEPEAVPPPVAVVTAAPAAPPEVAAKPIAKAVSKAAPKAVAAKPAAAPVPEAAAKPIAVSGIKPVEAAPPVPGKAAVAQQQLDLPPAKSKKKK